jgi:RNA ligase (TIGR02306 family)
MRTLCTVQTIKELFPIEGKDRIKLATFESTGWKVIVDLSYGIGQKVVYCEYDTVLPEGPSGFEFLRKRCYSPKYGGFRITAMKMAGVVSEGIVFPMGVLSDVLGEQVLDSLVDGYDVTGYLKAQKYDPELQEENQNKKKHGKILTFLFRFKWIRDMFFSKATSENVWPSWARKSDETRIQSLGQSFIDECASRVMTFVVNEKLDGTSTLYGIYKKKFYVCSRNNKYPKPKPMDKSNKYWQYALDNSVQFRLREMSRELGYDFYIQGELCGPGIQGNKYKLEKLSFYVYSMYDIKNDRFIPELELFNICLKYKFTKVPHLLYESFVERTTVDELVELSKGPSMLNPETLREGVVFRELYSSKGGGKMGPVFGFKVINPDFIVKWGL